MKKFLALLALLFAGSAGAQQLILCSPTVPCDTSTGPVNTGTGDPAWKAFGKYNFSIQNLNASDLTSGTLPLARFPLFFGAGANACAGSVPCNADTYLNPSESITCSAGTGGVAVISGLSEHIPASYVGAAATATGCGAWAARSEVGGSTVAVASGGSGYATTSPAPVGGDYITISGGTPVNGSSFTGSITNGVLTVASGITGQIYLGQTISWSGSTGVTLIQNFMSGKGGAGTYQLTGTTTSQSSIAMTGTNRTVLRVMVLGGPITGAASTGGTGTAGGPYTSISLTNVSGQGLGSGAVATVTMGGAGGTHVVSAAITTPGTGYAPGDVLGCNTIPGGSGCTIQVSAVNSSGGAIAFAAVVGGGQYSALPGTCTGASCTVSQLATSGSGSGATFTLTYLGMPLSGTVASVQWNGSTGGFTFATGTNAIATYTSQTEQWAIGHFDDAGVNSVLATGPSALIFPPTITPSWGSNPLGYSFQNPITLITAYRFSMLCNGARIIALAPIDAQITSGFFSSSLLYRPLVHDCELQGMGLANHGIYNSGPRWVYSDTVVENDVISNVFIGDTDINGLYTASDNAADVMLDTVRIHNDTNAVPQLPAYPYEMHSSADNQVNKTKGDSGMWGGAYIDGADDQFRNAHFFAFAAGPGYRIDGSKTGIGGITDQPGPGQAGYYVNSTLVQIHDGWQVSLGNNYQGQSGVYLANNQHNTIDCGTGANNAAWALNYTSLLVLPNGLGTSRSAPCNGNGGADPPTVTGPLTANGDATINGNLSFTGTCAQCGTTVPSLQGGIPFGAPPSSFIDANGNLVIGANPASSGTVSFSATSGSVTVTLSAAGFSNSASDVNRVVTVLDTTYITCLITAQLSTTTATCTLSATLSGTGPFANANSWISGSGTAAQATGGGVTYPAAFSTVYSGGIYLYFSGTTAGPAQGIYWCVMASLATGVCYTTSYSTGNGTLTGAAKPAIPGSPVQMSGLTPGTFAQTTGAAIVMAQGSLAANALGTMGCLDYEAFAVSNNSANTKAISARLNTFGPSNSVTTQPINSVTAKICNTGVANSQVGVMRGSGGATGNVQVPTASTGVSRTSVATTSTQPVSFGVNLATATDNIVIEDYSIKYTSN